MRSPSVLVIVALSMLLLPSGAALHCNGDITTVTVGPETLYVEHRPGGGSPFYAPNEVLIYIESNGMPGLQSGGDSIFLEDCQIQIPGFCYTDTCWHWPPDTRIYPGVQS